MLAGADDERPGEGGAGGVDEADAVQPPGDDGQCESSAFEVLRRGEDAGGGVAAFDDGVLGESKLEAAGRFSRQGDALEREAEGFVAGGLKGVLFEGGTVEPRVDGGCICRW
jgi:hypothetical protein